MIKTNLPVHLWPVWVKSVDPWTPLFFHHEIWKYKNFDLWSANNISLPCGVWSSFVQWAVKTRDELNCIGFPSCVQEAAGAFCTEDLGKDVIFLPIHQAAWLEKSQAQGHAYVREMLAQTSWAYCQGIARAIHIWTGEMWRGWQLWNSCIAACCSFKEGIVGSSPTNRDL